MNANNNSNCDCQNTPAGSNPYPNNSKSFTVEELYEIAEFLERFSHSLNYLKLAVAKISGVFPFDMSESYDPVASLLFDAFFACNMNVSPMSDEVCSREINDLSEELTKARSAINAFASVVGSVKIDN